MTQIRPASSPKWQIYDDLIDGIPDGVDVVSYEVGSFWARVRTSEDHVGIAMHYVHDGGARLVAEPDLRAAPLRDVAALAKSWNANESSIGIAAINAWYNKLDRAQAVGRAHPSDVNTGHRADTFDVFREEIVGKKVAVIGHFSALAADWGPLCDLTILERNPRGGDLPDPACEYILDEQDYVFATGSVVVNKTLPRLLELSKNAKFTLMGPSSPMAPSLLDAGVHGLSGFCATDIDAFEDALRGVGTRSKFDHGVMLNQIALEP